MPADREARPRIVPAEPRLASGDLPGAGGRIGPEPEDFAVDELPEHEPSGEGEHLWVRVRKRALTTQDAIALLARAAHVRPGDVGSAGMKDKHAVTTQWLSLPAAAPPPETWQLPPELEVLEHRRHGKKLRTGQLAGNRFRIRLVEMSHQGLERAEAICRRLVERGVPNHFGAQRFGLGGGNLERALAWLIAGAPPLGKKTRFYRKLYPSVIQAEVFNRYLDRRSELGLDRLLAGEVVRLDGSSSVFVVEDPERELPRLGSGDIHLTGPMPGPKMKQGFGIPAELEATAKREAGLSVELEERLGALVDGTRRDLVLVPKELSVRALAPGSLELAFVLPAGGYATQLVRELTRAPWYSPPP